MDVKKCPFCGCSSIKVMFNTTHKGTFYWAECGLCKSRTRSFFNNSVFDDLPDELYYEVLSFWNTRMEGINNGRTENVCQDDCAE